MSPIKEWLDSRRATRVVQVVAVLALLLSIGIAARQFQMTKCQARYAAVSNTSQRARAEAATTDRDALDKLLVAIADNPRSAIDAIRDYNASRALADRQRAANPVPPPPAGACG